MAYTHYGAIDIGSNAVRLLIKRLEDDVQGRFSKDVLLRVPLRLGQEVFTTGKISDKKEQKLLDLMRAYAIVLNLYDVEKVNFRGCATASFREATNGRDIIDNIRNITGLNIEIISGEEEATIVCGLNGPTQDRTLVYVDVGGGSTEVSLISNGQTLSRHSYPIGTVRIINNVVAPEWQKTLTEDMNDLYRRLSMRRQPTEKKIRLVGAGGNINKLFALATERDTTERTMNVDELRTLHTELSQLSVEERMVRYKLKPDRADVIVPAAQIFLTIADALHVAEIEIPADGLADGIIADIWTKQNKQK